MVMVTRLQLDGFYHGTENVGISFNLNFLMVVKDFI